ncbi:MAG: response regulator [Planctomycetes bacterium]|nr:response regulator [Planctomycetota bacterium]
MKIILADDSITMRKIVTHFLEDMGHTEVLPCQDGLEVLELLKTNPDVKLVLLDWNMPFMNGIDCLKKIKANPDCCDIPVVMLTSEALKTSIKEAVTCGAANYLVKPFEQEKFRAVVDKALASA